MVGPMDFILNEEAGILFEGYELEPMLRHPWHPPYYKQRFDEMGLLKAMDLFHYHLHISDRDERMLPLMFKVAERARTRYGVRLRRMSWWHLRRELDEFAKVYNAAWAGNWGFVPYTKEELDEFGDHLPPDLLARVLHGRRERRGDDGDRDHDPGHQPGLQEDEGAPVPARVVLLPQPQSATSTAAGSVSSACFPSTSTPASRPSSTWSTSTSPSTAGSRWGEAGWILESNHSMNRALGAMGSTIVKRCRVYERLFEEGAERSAPPGSSSTEAHAGMAISVAGSCRRAKTHVFSPM